MDQKRDNFEYNTGTTLDTVPKMRDQKETILILGLKANFCIFIETKHLILKCKLLQDSFWWKISIGISM